MRIIVRGWGRDQGEREIMNASLEDAEVETGGNYTRGSTYLHVEYEDIPRMTKVRISTSTELRLGGSYLLQIQLSRNEIAQLFYKTHSGDVVRMFRSFIEDEERQAAARRLEQIAQYEERRRQRLAQKGQEE